METGSYFKLRGIDPDQYFKFEVPFWFISRISKISKNAKFLDFGSGYGQWIHSLRSHGYTNLYAADIEPDALDFLNESKINTIDLRNGFDAISNLKNSFDVIFTSHVLEHISKDEVVQVLKHLRDLLKSDGELYIAVPNAQAFTNTYWAYEDFTHHTMYTYGSLRYILQQAGFTSIEIIDKDALEGSKALIKLFRSFFQKLFYLRYQFWKKILGSPTHINGEESFCWEIKVRVRKT